MDEVRVKIAGYRQLSEKEQATINNIKRLEQAVLATIVDVGAVLREQRDAAMDPTHGTEDERRAVRDRVEGAEPQRWLAIGKTNIEQGFMAVVRAIAQPVNK